MEFIDLDGLNRNLERDKRRFLENKPFKHIVFDGLVQTGQLEPLIQSFPGEDWDGWYNADHTHQRLKSSCSETNVIPVPLRTVIYELNSGPFLHWLSELTGIDELLPDPNLIGGGLHRTAPGGWLSPHTDFHLVKGIPLYRRINLLLYLNPEWSDENGGFLELWDKQRDKIEIMVPPLAGKCVIFQTDNDSMHGFSSPVQGRARCSVAMYYYTAQDAERFSGDGATYWRPESVAPNTAAQWLQLRLEGLFMRLSQAASSVSWRAASMASRFRPQVAPGGDGKGSQGQA